MKEIPIMSAHLAIILICVCLQGCSSIDTSGLAGNVSGGFYTSPNKTFRVQIPPLLDAPRVKDYVTADQLGVLFADAFCRQYVIWEQQVGLDNRSLDQLVEKIYIERMKADGILLKDRKSFKTGLGPAIALRYRHKQGAPCVARSYSASGQRVETPPDAEVLMYILNKNGVLYTFMYELGDLNNFEPWQLAPLDNKLAPFLAGFELLPQEMR